MKRSIILSLALFLFSNIMIFPQETEEMKYPPQAILNAAYMGDIQMMERILHTNPDKDARDALGGTALHVAVFKSNLEAIQLLLEHGFDINAKTSSTGYTPLHYCVWLNNLNVARFLLLYNADRNIRDNNGQTPLEKAAKESKRDMMLILSRR